MRRSLPKITELAGGAEAHTCNPSEPRLQHCTPAWQQSETLSQKQGNKQKRILEMTNM